MVHAMINWLKHIEDIKIREVPLELIFLPYCSIDFNPSSNLVIVKIYVYVPSVKQETQVKAEGNHKGNR